MFTVNDVQLMGWIKNRPETIDNVEQIRHLAETKYLYRKSKDRTKHGKNT